MEWLEEGHCFLYGAIFVFVVKDVDGLGRLRVVVLDIAPMLFVAETEAAAGLAHILFVACYP